MQTGDVFHGKGQWAEGADREGLVETLSAIAARSNEETIVITGHGELSTRAEIREYVALLRDSIE